MSSASSSHRRSFRAFALVALLAAAPAACLDLGGLPADSTSAGSTSGAGGAGGVEITTSTSATMATATSGASSSSGPVTCTPGTISPCAYGGPAGTEDKGVCKAGTHKCQPDGMSYGACTGEVVPAVEDCVNAVDEDCSGASKCTGGTVGGAGFIGEVSTNDDEVVFAVATDKAGNIVLGGVEGSIGNNYLDYSISSGNGAIRKLSPTGQKLWSNAVTVGGTGYAVIRGVATDAAGDVIVLGEYQEAIVGGDFSLPKGSGVDIFLIKLLGATGKPVWQTRFIGTNEQYPHALALDANGNIFVAGTTYGPVDFGGGATSGGGDPDLFVAKLDKDGKYIWSKAYGDAQPQVGIGLAMTPEGDVVVVGALRGKLDFGGGKSVTGGNGDDDVFVAKLKGDTGVGLWAASYGDASNQQANGVVVGSDGSVVITGQMVGGCNFGGANLDAKMNLDVFVAKLKADGSHVWSHNYGSGGENQAGLRVTIDPAQNIVVVGYFKDTLDFGAPTMTLTDAAPKNTPETDMFVAKLAADGSSLWARSFGDTNDQAAWAVTTDAAANVIVGGSFKGTMNLPPAITSTGNYDAFWLKLAP
jgi:hypothetical protein